MPKFDPITDRRRELIFWVIDDDRSLLPVCYHMTSYRRCDQILLWLVQNRMTGHNLKQWIGMRWGNSLLDMVKYILMRLDRDSAPKAIYAGGEYLPQ